MRIVVLGSGRGSNAEALLQAQQAGQLGRAQVVAIFSDKEQARILTLGDTYGVPAHYLNPGKYKTWLTPDIEAQYVARIREYAPDMVVLAGFMRVLKADFLHAFEGKIINLHPSLLPSFPGLHSIRQAYEYGVKITGCTVHYVNAQVDGGRILDQAAVRIQETDTLETLEAKVHAAEHQLLPAVIARLSEES